MIVESQNKSIPPCPVPLVVIFENIPSALIRFPNWVVWCYDYRDEDWTKTPIDAKRVNDGEPIWAIRASSQACRSWCDFKAACIAYAQFREARTLDGIGFAVNNTPYTAIDLDKCIVDGIIDPWAQAIINRFQSYSEISPSGKGVRIFIQARINSKGNRVGKIEVYDTARYVTVSGHHIPDTPATIEDRQDVLDQWHKETFPPKPERVKTPGKPTNLEDETIISKALASKNGDKFKRLWDGGLSDYDGDHSAADMALVSMLAFWTGPDEEHIDNLFRQSGLMRDKWDRDDYRHRTIAAVLDNEREYYHAPQDDIDAIIERPDIDGKTYEIPEKIGYNVPELTVNIPEAKPAKTARYFTLDELWNIPAPTWLVEDHFLDRSMGLIFGFSGSFKSFYALDLALSVATGRQFLDKYKTRMGKVLYIASEGLYGLAKRTQAWTSHYGIKPPAERFRIIGETFAFTDAESTARLGHLQNEIFGSHADLILIDTMSRNFGADKNPDSTQDMQTFCNNLAVYTRKSTIIPIHHCGWNNQDRERSSSAIRDSVDTSIHLRRTEGSKIVDVTCKKQKDFDEFQPYCIEGNRSHDSLIFTHSYQKVVDKSPVSLFPTMIPGKSVTDVFKENETLIHEMGWNEATFRNKVSELKKAQKVIVVGHENKADLYVQKP